MSKTRSGAPRRVAAGLLAGALAVFGLALTAPAGADTVDEVEDACGRLAGQTRFGTAGAISDAYDTEAGGVDTAIIANGRNFPDALAASGLARTLGAPILLIEPPAGADTVPLETQSALDELGVSEVVIVGGTAAVSEDVEEDLADRYGSARRVAGPLREDTAAEIAGEVGTAGSFDGLVTAIIATGDNYPDALAGGPISYHGDGTDPFPILLTRGDDVPASTEAALNDLGVEQVIVLGGTAAVPATTVAELATITGNDPIVLAGPLREDTAKEVADFAVDELGFDLTAALLADGREHFPSPDALSGGPLGGITDSPILLVTPETLPPATEDFLTERAPLEQTIALGGTAAVAGDVLEDACTAAGVPTDEEPPAAGVTSRPELMSASVIGTVTSGINAGTTVRYVFDEAIQLSTTTNPPVAGLFHAVSNSSTRYDGDSFSAVSGQTNAIDVLYTDAALQSAANAASLTVATVDLNAVRDLEGEGSPEGDRPLGAQSGTPLPAGITAAPDLVSVGNFRAASSTQTFIDFVFDEGAWVVNNNGFALIELDNNQAPCAYNNGTGTTTLTVVCANAGVHSSATTPITAADISRGVVFEDAVSDLQVGGNTNPLQAADVSNSGNTGAPDLVSATFDQNATVGGTAFDQVVFVFDQAVSTGATGSTAFNVYLVNGQDNEDAGAAATNPEYSSTTPNSVRVTYPNGTLANATGASVDDGAVIAASGANIGAANQEDEVGVANTTSGTTSGLTNSPDLTQVLKTAGTDIFGTPTGGSDLTYIFDEDIQTITQTLFFAYLADGTRLTASACTIGTTEDTDNRVICTAYTTPGGTAATNAAENAIVLGTVDNGAVTSQVADGSDTNAAEGAEPTTS